MHAAELALTALRARCDAAPIFVQATEAEWAALVTAEGHRYRLDAMEEGIECNGCWVLPPWVRVRQLQQPETVASVNSPRKFADQMLVKHGCHTLVQDQFHPRFTPLPGQRRRR